MQPRILLLMLLGVITLYSIKADAQSCNPLSNNFTLGGSTHDAAFQDVDALNAAATLSNGNFVVSWETRDGVDGDQGGAFFQVFSADGTAITDVIIPYADVNASGQGDQGLFAPKVVALQSGFVMAWESKNGPGDTGPQGGADLEAKDAFFRVYNDNGEAISTSTRLDNSNREDILEFVLPLTNGGFAILASIGEDGSGNTDDFFIETFNAQGQQLTSGPVNISDAAHDGGFQTINKDQAMAALPNGRFAVTWEARGAIDGDGTGGFLRIFNADGSAVTNVITPYNDVNPSGTGDQALFGSRVIALTNGNVAMAWTSEGGPNDIQRDVWYKVFDNNGNAQSGSAIRVNEGTDEGRQSLNGLIPLKDGDFAILWHTESGLNDYYVRVLNGNNGLAINSITEISGGVHANVLSLVPFRNVGFIPLSSGGFAVGWAAYGGADGDQTGAYYRVFDASGNAQIPVTTAYDDINPAGTGSQSTFGPILEALDDGFVMAWESADGPGDVDKDVYHRIINNDGMPFCGTVKTNSDNDSGAQNIQFIQPLENGNFAAIYNGASTAGLDDLFVRVVSGLSKPSVCPTLGEVIISPDPYCSGEPLTFTLTGLENMLQAANGDQDFGITVNAFFFIDDNFDAYENLSLGLVATLSFDQLSDEGTSALIAFPENFDPLLNPLYVFSLNAVPADAACRPVIRVDLEGLSAPNTTYTAPEDLFENAGIQTGLEGGFPEGGVYSGPGVTDDGNGQTYSFDPTAAGGVGTYTITYTVNGDNGCEASASDEIEVLEQQTVCPTIGRIVVDPNPACINDTYDLFADGLANMSAVENGDQDYGIRFIEQDIPTDPYNSGLFITEVSFDELTDEGTTALSANRNWFSTGSSTITAVLSPTPADVACRPFVSVDITVFGSPLVSFTSPGDFMEDDGIQEGLSGGFPEGGIYSGPGVTDDGNGQTYSFDPAAAGGVGTYTITYTVNDDSSCEASASDVIEVLENEVTISLITDIDATDPVTGVALLDRQRVAIQGVVQCIDFIVGQGYQFWIFDANGDGILIFAASDIDGYNAQEGDEIVVEGTLFQAFGNLTINAEKIDLLSQFNAVLSPFNVSTLDESTENQLVTLEIDASLQDQIVISSGIDGDLIDFPTSSGTLSVFVPDATGISPAFINGYTNLQDISQFLITGIANQVDVSEPFTEGYSLTVCSEDDFSFEIDVDDDPEWGMSVIAFPNPVSSRLFLNSSIPMQIIRLIDIRGQVVFEATPNSSVFNLNLSNLEDGLYNLQVINGTATVNRQIVKQQQ